MTITIDQAQRAILAYLENEVARKASGLTKFGAYFVMGTLQNKFPSILSNFLQNPLISAMELVDGDGHIKIDEVYHAARSAMEKAGSISMYGVIFNQSDVDKLYHMMQTA